MRSHVMKDQNESNKEVINTVKLFKGLSVFYQRFSDKVTCPQWKSTF